MNRANTFVALTFAFAGVVLAIGYGAQSGGWLPWVVSAACLILGVACVVRLTRND